MSTSHNLQVVIEIRSQSHHITQTKHKNKQTMETKDTFFCQESFIDRFFLVLEILRVALCGPMATHGELG